MLKTVIDFIVSRTGLARDKALTEINLAWVDLWNGSDFPDSCYEITVKPEDPTPRMSLPWYVGTIRGVKWRNMERVQLLTPRPWYQDHKYYQHSYTWKVLGRSPLSIPIINAGKLSFEMPYPEDFQFTINVEGPTDHSSRDFESIIMPTGETRVTSVKRFTDARGIVKSALTTNDIKVLDNNNDELGLLPNCEYEARNIIVQVTDDCMRDITPCKCFDVLYKMPAPLLVNEYSTVDQPEALMNKTLEWIMISKPDMAQTTMLVGQKAAELLANSNNNDSSVTKKLDVATNRFSTRYHGYL